MTVSSGGEGPLMMLLYTPPCVPPAGPCAHTTRALPHRPTGLDRDPARLRGAFANVRRASPDSRALPSISISGNPTWFLHGFDEGDDALLSAAPDDRAGGYEGPRPAPTLARSTPPPHAPCLAPLL
jgi:hypothetical protein